MVYLPTHLLNFKNQWAFKNYIMSPYNWPSQMNMYENPFPFLLDGRYIINLLIMMNIQIRFKCHVSPWVTHPQLLKGLKCEPN
jgi:hypothetical protein